MKWIGQHIVDLIARFRSDVYLEDVSTGTIASGGNLGLDSNNKVVKADEDGATLTTEAVQDIVGGMFSSNTETRVAATYGDQDGKINVVVDDMTANTTYSIQDGELSQNNFTNADHTKLNGVETSATADQSNAEIRTAVEAATDSNVFTDADHTKLNGIEASATVDQSKADINALDITEVGTISSGVWEGTDVGVAHGGTGLSTVGIGLILTGNGTSALTAESNLQFGSNRLTIGANADIQPYISMVNDENVAEIGIANAADDFVTGSADGDLVINSVGDHKVIIAQNDTASLTIRANGTTLNRLFSSTSSTDGDYNGDVVFFGGTTSMTIGTIYHYKSDGTWEVANANAVATSDGLLGVALGAASNTNGMLLRGMVTLDHDPGAVGDVLYLSNTNGDASATAPSDNNDIVRVIGYCLHASNGQIWFNPDSTFVEVTA